MLTPQKVRNICVLRLSALGDVVLAVPAVRALARAWPDARITWITSRDYVSVLRGLPQNIVLEGIAKPRTLAEYLALRRVFAARPFDLLLAMQASLRANLIYPLIHAPLKIGFDRARARDLHGLFVNQRIAPGDQHLLEGFMAFALAAGVQDARVEWGLELDTAAVAWVKQASGGGAYILLNASASKQERTWPLERSARLAQQAMSKHRLPVVLCGGATGAERHAARQIAVLAPGVIDLAGQTSLPQLFALIAGARVLVSPDSGPVHVARAFNVPVVGLYASAHPQKTGAYQQLQWTVNAYPEAVRQLLGKDPATVAWDTRMRDARAMELITVQEVSVKLDAALSAPSA